MEDAFTQFRTVNQTYLRTKMFHVIYTVKLKGGKTLRLQENINKSDHLLLCLLFPQKVYSVRHNAFKIKN